MRTGELDGSVSFPQIKICGLTRVDEAVACAEEGVDAVGLVFYPPSPRFISRKTAVEICGSLPERIGKIGVFVNEAFHVVVETARTCGLDYVQLHGAETPEMVRALESVGINVIKAVFARQKPLISEASIYGASAYLIENGGGALPGGEGLEWRWNEAGKLADELPSILAGGLNPENVGGAILGCGPDAVDVSSGVECWAGRKDMGKVHAFVNAVRDAKLRRKPRRIFK